MTLDNPQEASELAEKVLALDSSIISVGVISDLGFLLAGAIRSDLKQRIQEDRKSWDDKAFRVAVMMGTMRTDDKEGSHIESIILIREDSKTLLIRLPDREAIFAIAFEKSKGDWDLSERVRKMFGLC